MSNFCWFIVYAIGVTLLIYGITKTEKSKKHGSNH